MYGFCRLVFGLKPSPAILGATIKNHLSNCSELEPNVIEVLKNDLYVDDLATGSDSEGEAVSLFKSAKSVMSNRGVQLPKMELQLLSSAKGYPECENTEDLNRCETIKEDDVSYAKISINPVSPKESNKVEVLGCTWNFVNDTLNYGVQELIEFVRLLPMTKRSVLKLSTPFTIHLKILFQELCLDATDASKYPGGFIRSPPNVI